MFVTITGQGVGHSTEEIGAPSRFGVLRQIDDYFRARGTIHMHHLSTNSFTDSFKSMFMI